ncbi:MAG: DNA polymerase, partial [Alphaproteobacteria bacterium]
NFAENIVTKNEFSLQDFDQILFDNSIRKLFYDSKEFLRIYHNFEIKKYQKFADSPWIFDDLKQMSYIINSANHFSLFELIQNFANSQFFDLTFMENLDKIEKNDFNDKIFLNDENLRLNFFANLNCGIIQIYENLAQKIAEQNLHHNYLKLELPLLIALTELEFNGILVDEEKLKHLSIFFSKKITEISAEIYQLAGEEFNIASSKQLGEILFEKLKIVSTKKSKKTKAFSTDNKVLEDLSFQGIEIADKIINFRKFSKLKNTYSDSLPKQINPLTKRIHSHFSASTTLTGRLSSFNPNLQNIPIKTLEGKKIRECFIAKKDFMFLSADYSQIELRILAHFAQIPELISAFANDKDIHIATASQIFNIPEHEISNELRSKAKAINFGIIYGISGFGLARQLGISNRDASNYIKSYFEKYQGIKDFMNKTIASADSQGFVTTISGRKCFIKDIHSKNPILKSEAQRQAINAPIQGSSADIIKKAMIKIHKIMKNKKMQSKMILQIHDELIFETTASEIEDLQKILNEEMINSYPLSVKLKIDFHHSNHW